MRSTGNLKESGKLADEDVENVTASRIILDKNNPERSALNCNCTIVNNTRGWPRVMSICMRILIPIIGLIDGTIVYYVWKLSQ